MKARPRNVKMRIVSVAPGFRETPSQAAVRALRTIKLCAMAMIGFVAGAEAFIMLHKSDDRAGGVFMGILITFGSIIIATAAATFEWILQNAADMKSENDLTV